MVRCGLSCLASAVLSGLLTQVPMATQAQSAEPSKQEAKLQAMWLCTVAPDLVAYGNDRSAPPDLTVVSPFTLTRVLHPARELPVFGVRLRDGRFTVGLGETSLNGSWNVHSWDSEDQKGPFITLMTVFPRKLLLVSYRSGPDGHVTYEATCEANPHIKEEP